MKHFTPSVVYLNEAVLACLLSDIISVFRHPVTLFLFVRSDREINHRGSASSVDISPTLRLQLTRVGASLVMRPSATRDADPDSEHMACDITLIAGSDCKNKTAILVL